MLVEAGADEPVCIGVADGGSGSDGALCGFALEDAGEYVPVECGGVDNGGGSSGVFFDRCSGDDDGALSSRGSHGDTGSGGVG